MTPESLQNRGLGIPWRRESRLCSLELAVDRESALEVCLVPTPELDKRKSQSFFPPAPEAELGSPRGMQERFLDRVHRASFSSDNMREDVPLGAVPRAPSACNDSRQSTSVAVVGGLSTRFGSGGRQQIQYANKENNRLSNGAPLLETSNRGVFPALMQ